VLVVSFTPQPAKQRRADVWQRPSRLKPECRRPDSMLEAECFPFDVSSLAGPAEDTWRGIDHTLRIDHDLHRRVEWM
jgi:hypothetical protein